MHYNIEKPLDHIPHAVIDPLRLFTALVLAANISNMIREYILDEYREEDIKTTMRFTVLSILSFLSAKLWSSPV